MSVSAFDVDGLLSEARALDGLEDFGDDSFQQPMQQLCDSLATQAQLNTIGSQVMRQRVLDILVTRLRVSEWLRRYPEILQEQIVAPLIIIGLPRTGTTFLHRTIAADPRMYAPLWYEVRRPSPSLQWDFTVDGDERIPLAQAEMQAMLEGNPDLLSIHPMDALGPEEDIMLLEQSFFSFNPQAFANVPGYDRWIEAQDHSPGYHYLKLLLQFLQWQKKRSGQAGQRWVLKAPHHLHFVDLVFKVFPDAKIVQTHRDPVATVPSLASLCGAVWKIYSDQADMATVGRLWADKFARGTRKTAALREQLPADRFLDLWFKDTVSQPLVEIEKIYDFIGLELTPEARTEMEQWQAFNRREQRPPHDYSLQQFGLSEQALAQQFSTYREAFISGQQ